MGKDKGSHRHNRDKKPYSKDNWRQKRQNNRPQGNSQQSTQNRNRRPNTGVTKVSLREDQVGITEFTSDCAGFTGVLKSRFSDFHVNEIDTNGKVLTLNDLQIPHQKEEKISEEQLAEGRKKLKELVNAEIWQQIEELAAAKGNTQLDKKIEIEVTALDKEQRTLIHNVLKQLYTDKVVSSTVGLPPKQDEDASNEQKFIRITKPKGGRNQRHKWTFPGDYVHFLVHKENMDTSEVAAAIADRMNLRPSQVNYCGTKDKRAKTTQKFCIKRRTPSQIVGAVKFIRTVHVGNFEFSNDVLKLGDLKGNRFRIALRHITHSREQIEASLKALRERGFINYFGLQRFGNCATVPTYEIGIALLKSDYKQACELILKPRDNDVDFMREIRRFWWEKRDSAAAAAMFRNDKFIEKKVLDGLAQYGENDYAGALRKIPRNMLLLYPHAYQSLIFNRIASRRIKEHGLKLIPGDLVYCNKDELDASLPETELEIVAMETDIKETSETEHKESIETEDKTSEELTSIYKRKVRPLSAEDIATGNYTLFDVVLPLPGYDVTYPENETAAWYEELLAEVGLSSEKLRHNVKTYALAGAYRMLLVQTSDLTWQFRRYKSAEETLLASDWEKLKNSELPSEPDAGDDGIFTALLLEFSLPTAAYATMLMRELLKIDTSSPNQAILELNELKKANSAQEVADEEMSESTKYIETQQAADGTKDEKETIGENNAISLNISQEKRKLDDEKVRDVNDKSKHELGDSKRLKESE